MREDAGDEQISNAKRESRGQNESISTREADVREHADTRDGDAGKQKGCDTSEDRIWNCNN
jgi:hypothetical protein